MIELTAEQVAATGRETAPLQVVNPRNGAVLVLIRRDVYDLTCTVAGSGPGEPWDDEADNDLIRKDDERR